MTRYEYLDDARKLGVDVMDVVTRILHIGGEERGGKYSFLCPVHDDHRPSADIDLTTGFWHCLSCGAGGDLISLAIRVLEIDVQAARDLLESRTPTAIQARVTALQAALEAREDVAPTLDVPLPYQYARGPLDELEARGFTRNTLRRWSVRYVASETLHGHDGPFNIYASIGIPIIDEQQRVLFWCYRKTENSERWQPRYLYSGGANVLRETWFGAQHHSHGDEIVIVEGALDAMWCDQYGIPALALLGSSMVAGKAYWLPPRFDRVTLLGDYDAAGAQAVARLGRLLSETSCRVYIAQYSTWMDAKDPQDLAPIDLELVLARAIPWEQYLHRRTLRSRST